MSEDPAFLPLSLAGPERSEPYDFEQLRIVITGTPKTGNTWLKHLFSQLYLLPKVDLDPNFHANDFDAFGRRWVGQQHYQPDPSIVAEGLKRGIVFVAPFRHPGDVLISLRHHIQKQGADESDDERLRTLLPAAMLEDGENVFGENTEKFVRDGFFVNLHLSIAWMRGGWALGVRYEDLWLQPYETFKAVTDRILPRTRSQLRHALSACEIGLMQDSYDPNRTFVRKGGLNSWVSVLPDSIKTVLAEQEPYPTQMAVLGYTMDAADERNARSAEPASPDNPFRKREFANGIPVAPIHLRAYFDQPEEVAREWPDGCAVGEGTFYAWLMQPAEADPHRGESYPVITEFNHWLYRQRSDLQEIFPDPFGEHRQQICDWFLFSACREYRYDRHFAVPILSSWARGRP